jgi:hypothetical protein
LDLEREGDAQQVVWRKAMSSGSASRAEVRFFPARDDSPSGTDARSPASESTRVNLAVRGERRNVVSRFLAARVLRAKHGRLAKFSARRYPWLHRFPSFNASF